MQESTPGKVGTELLITNWQNRMFLAVFDYIFVVKKAVWKTH
jgi:mRNA deadenylase 3'-5' endonuclease subunit Ccr4